MDETMISTEVQEQTSTDAFLDGWDDAAELQEADQPEEEAAAGSEEVQDEAAENEPAAEEKPAEPESQTEEQQKEPADVPKTWTLRHLDETKVVNEAELTALAQKGMDYDRIRTKYDESKPVMELFSQFAKQAGMSMQEYILHIRTQAKKANGMNDEEAKRAVDLEDREAAVAQAEAQAKEEKIQREKAEEAENRRKADIAEFQKAFPDAAKEPDKIPQEVWSGVRGGLSLVAAYAKYQVEKSKADAEAAIRETAAVKQNQKNAERSTGSMKSAGNDKRSRDPFLEGWDSL